jgi:hypothetical protein
MELLLEVFNWILHHSPAIGLVLTWAAIAWVYFRRRASWSQKQFLDQVNFSLSYVKDQTLAVRTLLETRANSVWLNDYGVKKILAAAQQTTPDQPFLRLTDPDDMAFVNRAVKNTLSERFAETFAAEALGVPVRTAPFIFAITNERYDDMRTLKLRVLLIEERTLLSLFSAGGPGESLAVTNPIFRARLRTLKGLYAMYVKGKETGTKIVDRVELGVVVS